MSSRAMKIYPRILARTYDTFTFFFSNKESGKGEDLCPCGKFHPQGDGLMTGGPFGSD